MLSSPTQDDKHYGLSFKCRFYVKYESRGDWGEKGGSNQRGEEEEEEDKCCVFCCVESAFKNTTSIYPCIHPPINYRRQGEQGAATWEDTGAHGNGEAGRQVEQEYNACVCETYVKQQKETVMLVGSLGKDLPCF